MKFRTTWTVLLTILGFWIVSTSNGQIHEYHNLRYADGFGVDHLLDLEVPDSQTPLPLVMFIHGGGWRNGDKNNFRSRALLDYGFAAASINYRLSGTAPWPAQIHDCKAAIRWLRANAAAYNINPEKIGVWGSSAGGHLVAMLGTTNGVGEVTIDEYTVDIEGNVGEFTGVSSHVSAVCDYFGPTDILSMPNPDGGALYQLLGDSATVNTGLAKSASPISFVDPTDVPFLIYHGDRDGTVPIQQSQILHDLLIANNVPSMFTTFEGSGHGGPAFASPAIYNEIADFFTEHLTETGGSAISDNLKESPHTFQIYPNTPNPFNPQTWIHYELDEPGFIHLSVYNPLGQNIRDLISGQKPAGKYKILWDGRDVIGNGVAGGLYLARLTNGKENRTIKMMLIR